VKVVINFQGLEAVPPVCSVRCVNDEHRKVADYGPTRAKAARGRPAAASIPSLRAGTQAGGCRAGFSEGDEAVGSTFCTPGSGNMRWEGLYAARRTPQGGSTPHG
jgi:hypothetical protein